MGVDEASRAEPAASDVDIGDVAAGPGDARVTDLHPVRRNSVGKRPCGALAYCYV